MLEKVGPAPDPPDMDAIRQRLAQHDAQIEALQQLGHTINDKLDTLLRTIPSRAGLWGMVATVMAVAIAVVGLFVGVLTYLQAFRAPPATSTPIVIQMPAPSPSSPPAKH